MRISFLGLGNMGYPLAENFLKAKMDLMIYSRRKDVVEHFEKNGARVAVSIEALADCDVLCTCLPMPQDVVEAVTGKYNLYGLMKSGSLHIELSTIGPATAKTLAADAAAKGIAYVQSLVNKSPQVAREGKSPFFVGGDPDAVKRAMPILAKIGKPQDLHTLEAACGAKLISNFIGMTNTAVMAEGLRLAQLAGMELHEAVNLLLDTGAASYSLKMRGPMVADDDFKARFSVDLAFKDLRICQEMARDLHFDPKNLEQTLSYLQQAHDAGFGDEDVVAMFKVIH